MKKVSAWASQHKWTTRFGIVAIYFLLNTIGFFLGDIMSSIGVVIPAYVAYLLLLPFLLAFIFYPARKAKARYRDFYRSRKAADAVLAGTSFLLIVCISNQPSAYHAWLSTPVHSASVMPPSHAMAESFHPVEPVRSEQTKNSFSIKQWKKTLRKNIQLLRKEYRAARDGEKAALIILSVLVALALEFLLIAGSCSIACAGADGLAVAVFLIGTGLIVFLLVKVILRIQHGPQKLTVQESAT